jgi:hypothetical protein
MLKNTKEFITLWVILIGVLAALSYMASSSNPIVRPRLERIEPFQNSTSKSDVPNGGAVPATNSISPATLTLQNPREPYNLLNGVLPPSDAPAPSPSSAACYDADFQKRLERTGNYRQLTNNYKRGVPDSCSAPNHDLVMGFYKVEALPAA